MLLLCSPPLILAAQYLLPNGDGGIIRTLDAPLYLAHVRGNRLHLLDRECKVRARCSGPSCLLTFSFRRASPSRWTLPSATFKVQMLSPLL